MADNDVHILFQGAESKVYLKEYLGKTVLVKERFVKMYRNANLDKTLTKERIKAESRNIVRCQEAGIRVPEIYKTDLDNRLIYMEYFQNAVTSKTLIDELQSKNDLPALHKLSEKIGKIISTMHARRIIHGDLTTSNILVENDEIILIDFGLSASNASDMEKGVDLYVLERALDSTHINAKDIFQAILDSYKSISGKEVNSVLVKFEDVRARGRKRTMVG